MGALPKLADADVADLLSLGIDRRDDVPDGVALDESHRAGWIVCWDGRQGQRGGQTVEDVARQQGEIAFRRRRHNQKATTIVDGDAQARTAGEPVDEIL